MRIDLMSSQHNRYDKTKIEVHSGLSRMLQTLPAELVKPRRAKPVPNLLIKTSYWGRHPVWGRNCRRKS